MLSLCLIQVEGPDRGISDIQDLIGDGDDDDGPTVSKQLPGYWTYVTL